MENSKENRLPRRQFLQSTAKIAGLSVGFYFAPRGFTRIFGAESAAAATTDFRPNAFINIASDNQVTVYIKHLEMGQGVYTGLPMIIAEELEVDPRAIRVQSAPADAKLYNNLSWGPVQGTGGSSSVSNSWDQLRMAGASTREVLISAAAVQLKVPRQELTAALGHVVHAKTGKRLPYGALIENAKKLQPPTNIKLKETSQFKVIGQSISRLDGAEKTTGEAKFSMDVRTPGQLTALVKRPPTFNATAKSYNAKDVLKIKGVKKVVVVPSGVAVIAENYWAATKGRDALNVVWDESRSKKVSSETQMQQYRDLLKKPGAVATTLGDRSDAAKKSFKTIEAQYEFPYLAHAPMETLNCVIEFKNGRCTIWSGDQMQTVDQMNAAAVLGIKPERVAIHTMLAGGSFGRRANASSDYIVEAAHIVKASKLKQPVHLIWSREDDIMGGYYRPAFAHSVKASVDRQGKIASWEHRIVGQSILKGTPFGAGMQNGVDPVSVEGISDLAYDTPHLHVELHSPEHDVKVLWWRSVGHSHTAFVSETMIDELATAAALDPLEFRRQHLSKHPRHLAALNLAAEKAGWGKKLAKGKGRGIAVHESFQSFVAQVVEVSMTAENEFKIDRVVCAIDCGIAVNPDNIRAQMEGGIGFALGAALYGKVTLKDGAPEQSNFHDYRVLRLNEMPAVEVHIVPSSEKPTGVGEPGVPPLAPALANAVFAASGKRVRSLPMIPS